MERKLIVVSLLSILLGTVLTLAFSSFFLPGPPESPQGVVTTQVESAEPAGPVPGPPESPQVVQDHHSPPNYIPGSIYTGDYIRIGVNKGGTFGVGSGDPGTGFQYPIGPSYESVAIWWWGEGYSIFYRVYNSSTKVWEDRKAYYYPAYGWPPPASCRINYISAGTTAVDSVKWIYKVQVQTVDKVLNITFTFTFRLHEMYVDLETKILNTGAMGSIYDLLYKRTIDWDIHQDTWNNWTSDADAAYASYYNKNLSYVYTMSMSGYDMTSSLSSSSASSQVSYVDLNAWDDLTDRGPGSLAVQNHGKPIPFDGCACLYYDLGNLFSGSSKNVMTVYQASKCWYAP